MKKARLLIILVVLVLALFCYTGFNQTYSRYKKDIDVNVIMFGLILKLL